VKKVLGDKESDAGHYTQIRMDVELVEATIDGKDVNVTLLIHRISYLAKAHLATIKLGNCPLTIEY